MSTQLSDKEIEQLKEFRYTNQRFPSELTIPLIELLDDQVATSFLKRIQVEINAPDLRVAASMFMKRYGFFAVLNLFAMTIFNKRFNTSLSDLSLETNENEDVWYWNPKFYFFDTNTISPSTEGRKKWREETLSSIFRDNIYEVLILLNKHTKLSKITLWENIAIYIFWLYESVLQDPKFADKKDLIKDDFQYIVEEAKGSLFGQLNQNPLTRFFHEKTYHSEYQQDIRTRTTCCLYYLTDEHGERCKTCPLTCGTITRKGE